MIGPLCIRKFPDVAEPLTRAPLKFGRCDALLVKLRRASENTFEESCEEKEAAATTATGGSGGGGCAFWPVKFVFVNGKYS